MTGGVARGKVLTFERRGDVDGIDAAAIYAWLDESSNVHLHELAASFDPVHAGLGPTLTDASTLLKLEEGREITIVFDPANGQHLVYEALGGHS